MTTRRISFEDDEEVAEGLSHRRELYDKEHLQLVAMLEESQGNEIAAMRLANRAMSSLQDVYDTAKAQRVAHEQEIEEVIASVWEEAIASQTTSNEILTNMLEKSFTAILSMTGRARVNMARFYVDIVTSSIESAGIEPVDDEWAERIASGYYRICQLACSVPARVENGEPCLAGRWYRIGAVSSSRAA